MADTGIGIPSDKIFSIMDPFTQADVSTSRDFGGTGLGLPISNQLAELMIGKIDVESEIGEGTKFTVSIPVEVSAPAGGTEELTRLDEQSLLKLRRAPEGRVDPKVTISRLYLLVWKLVGLAMGNWPWIG